MGRQARKLQLSTREIVRWEPILTQSSTKRKPGRAKLTNYRAIPCSPAGKAQVCVWRTGENIGTKIANANVRFGSCVDGSPLARAFLMFCPSVGAAMCAAC